VELNPTLVKSQRKAGSKKAKKQSHKNGVGKEDEKHLVVCK